MVSSAVEGDDREHYRDMVLAAAVVAAGAVVMWMHWGSPSEAEGRYVMNARRHTATHPHDPNYCCTWDRRWCGGTWPSAGGGRDPACARMRRIHAKEAASCTNPLRGVKMDGSCGTIRARRVGPETVHVAADTRGGPEEPQKRKLRRWTWVVRMQPWERVALAALAQVRGKASAWGWRTRPVRKRMCGCG